MGVLAPGSAHARPSAGVAATNLKQLTVNFLAISGDSKHFLCFPKKKLKKRPPNLCYPKSYFFCDLKPHAKFWNPTITPSGTKVTTLERKKRERERKKEKKTPLIVDT